MPSRGDVRRGLERAARAIALAALGVLVWRRWNPAEVDAPALRVGAAEPITPALVRATTSRTPSLSIVAETLPDRTQRDWLDAIARAGTRVAWSAPPTVRPSAASVEPIVDPARRSRIIVRAAGRTSLVMRDEAGLLDSTLVAPTGVREVEAGVSGAIEATVPGAKLLLAPADSVVLRPVLVLARAGWEAKFVVAALEEGGWTVDARLAVAPGAFVTQGTPASIDTSRYAAVIVLDESANAQGAAIARYVRSGGGAVIAGAATHLAAFASILPARAGDTLPATLGALGSASPRRGLAALALPAGDADAVVVESRGRAPVIVAARRGLGRIVATGYLETWRWRMQGSDGSDAAHRAWWSSLVSSVAFAPVIPRSDALPPASTTDPAPFAAMVARFGPAVVQSAPPSAPPVRTDGLLFAVVLAGLLAEWGSRRTRGAR